MKKKAAAKKETPLPIPLRCHPQIIQQEDGKKRCIHSFESGACDLDTELMCPFYLRWLKENPDAKEVPVEIPLAVMERVTSLRPIPELKKF